MAYDFSSLKQKVQETESWLQNEYFGIRTGRATPAVLDGVKVESYGILVPLNQVANVNIEDARTLRILPYNSEQSKEIEKAIAAGDLGLSVSSDGKGVRVSFPELTSESREKLLRVVRDKLEQARISLRNERDHVWSDIQKQEKDGEITEDDKFTLKEEMQKIVDNGNDSLESVADAKERELKG